MRRVLEDEAQRNLPAQVRTLSSMDQDGALRRSYRLAYQDMSREKSGDHATAAARYGLAMKSAQVASEAILNAMLAAETMTGADGYRVYGLPRDRLMAALRKYGRAK